MIAEFDCKNFSMQDLKITDEEIIINGLKTPISSILDVVLFPIGDSQTRRWIRNKDLLIIN